MKTPALAPNISRGSSSITKAAIVALSLTAVATATATISLPSKNAANPVRKTLLLLLPAMS